MITNISLIIIGLCFLFIVMNRRIDLKWFAKGIMCIGMILIIGVLAIPKHHDILMDGLFVVMAFLTCYGTIFIYKKGSYQ
jgi:hypothetical protein